MKRGSTEARIGTGAAVAGACLMLAITPASASETYDYEPDIPNGSVHTCLTCHNTMDGIDQNLFGLDVQNHKAGDGISPDWAAVCAIDSDLDGQTNGQELGDPCCEWQKGEPAPRTTDISNPGDDSDLSANPDAPGCSDEDDGGCAVAGAGGANAPAGAAALMAALVLLLAGCRRRRR